MKDGNTVRIVKLETASEMAEWGRKGCYDESSNTYYLYRGQGVRILLLDGRQLDGYPTEFFPDRIQFHVSFTIGDTCVLFETIKSIIVPK